MLSSVLWIYRVTVALLVGAFVYDFFAPTGMDYDMGAPAYLIIAVLALAEPVFWAVMHLCGGVMMGVAAGGILDGIKLSLILGVGLGLSRLWVAVLGAAAGTYAGGGPLLYSIGGVVVAFALFGLERGIMWMWHYSDHDA
ncbi:MAG: hypothetical protein WAZ18_06330 [Alphaproteobacteria bacterium]